MHLAQSCICKVMLHLPHTAMVVVCWGATRLTRLSGLRRSNDAVRRDISTARLSGLDKRDTRICMRMFTLPTLVHSCGKAVLFGTAVLVQRRQLWHRHPPGLRADCVA